MLTRVLEYKHDYMMFHMVQADGLYIEWKLRVPSVRTEHELGKKMVDSEFCAVIDFKRILPYCQVNEYEYSWDARFNVFPSVAESLPEVKDKEGQQSGSTEPLEYQQHVETHEDSDDDVNESQPQH
jgi:hypothetical protein